MSADDHLGPQFHGTKRKLRPGQLIEPGHRSNHGSVSRPDSVYMSSRAEDATQWGDLAKPANKPTRTYEVAPTGEHRPDPNYKFGRVSKSPLRVVREL
jgi:hypothetical protein